MNMENDPCCSLPWGIKPELPANCPIHLISPVVLAYVGDAIFEVYVRQRLVAKEIRKPHHLHHAATSYVSAAAQAHLLKNVWIPYLTDEELEIVRRGRNAKSGQPPKNANPADYRHATALECLVGYLYYGEKWQRLAYLMNMAFQSKNRNEEDN